MTSVPQPADAGQAPGPLAQAVMRLAQRWAEAARAQSIYPAGHHRGATALQQWRAALDEARALPEGRDAALRIVFTHQALLAQGAAFSLEEQASLVWLRERLDHGGLAGLEVLPGAQEAALEALNARLLEAFADKRERRDPAEVWAGDWAGLRLLDRRFEGLFDGDSGDQRRTQRTWGASSTPVTASAESRHVARALLKDASIVARLTAIHARLAAENGPEGDESDRVVARLAELIPALARKDEREICGIAAALLDALEGRLEQRATHEALDGFLADPALERRAAFLSAALMRRDVSEENAKEVRTQAPAGPGGHAGDERYSDDPAAFLEDLEGLPATSAETWAAEPVESASEQLGVLLHVALHHAHLERLPGLEPALARALAVPDASALRTLRRVVEAAAGRADAQGPGQPLQRLFALLRRLERLPLLRRCGWLVAERVVESFPQDFGAWLSTLDLTRGDDRRELLDVVQRVGEGPIQAAATVLCSREALAAPGLAARLMAIPSNTLAPLARLLLEHLAGESRELVAGWLRSLQLTGPLAAVLQVVDDSVPLPDPLLSAVLDEAQGREGQGDLTPQVVPALAQFVRATAGRQDRRARRLQALRLLGRYDHPLAREVLRQVAHGRRWLVVPIEELIMRRAASEALARRGAA